MPKSPAPTRVFAEGGYEYDQVSDWWRMMCSVLPCFAALEWPGYRTRVIPQGPQRVIQLWKGLCEPFMASSLMPGGVGAEVGLYIRDSSRDLEEMPIVYPDGTPEVCRKWVDDRIAQAKKVSREKLWWPDTANPLPVHFKLTHPTKGHLLFASHEFEQRTWWKTQWMTLTSYGIYKRAPNRKLKNEPAPKNPADWNLTYTIDGTTATW